MSDGEGRETDPAHPHGSSPARPSATFGNQPPGLAVQINAGSIQVNASNLAALDRLARANPDLASKIIDASNNATRYETRKYTFSVVMTGLVCLAIIGCSTAVIISRGFWSGIALFLTCAAVAAIITAVYTGKGQDLSWTANLLGRVPKADKDTK